MAADIGLIEGPKKNPKSLTAPMMAESCRIPDLEDLMQSWPFASDGGYGLIVRGVQENHLHDVGYFHQREHY
jgi:hypothetical protein